MLSHSQSLIKINEFTSMNYSSLSNTIITNSTGIFESVERNNENSSKKGWDCTNVKT